MAKHYIKKYPWLRACVLAGFITFSILLLGMGFIIVDYNTRLIGFGQSSLNVDVVLESDEIILDWLGHEIQIQFPQEIQNGAGYIWTLLPAGIKAAVWMVQGEFEAAANILQSLING
jgi:hypothetical protein